MKKFTYCGRCYETDDVYPFGFCRKCWVKHGKPKAMNGDIVAQ